MNQVAYKKMGSTPEEVDPLSRFPGYTDNVFWEAIGKDRNALILYQDLVSASSYFDLGEGWFYRTHAMLKHTTGMGRKAVISATKKLQELGLIEHKLSYVCLDKGHLANQMSLYRLLKYKPQAGSKPAPKSTKQVKIFDSYPTPKDTFDDAPGDMIDAIPECIHIEIKKEKENVKEENTTAVSDIGGLSESEKCSSEETGVEVMKKDFSEKVVKPANPHLKKQVASVTELKFPLTGVKKPPSTSMELYHLFINLYAKSFQGKYPENMTPKVRAQIVAIKGVFGEDTPQFFELVIKNWAAASAYVSAHTTGLTPVKVPSLGYIRLGTNLMHFRSWWDSLQTDTTTATVTPISSTVLGTPKFAFGNGSKVSGGE